MLLRTEKRVYGKLDKNLRYLQETFDHQADLEMRRIKMRDGRLAVLVYIEALIDQSALQRQILDPLLYKIESAKYFFRDSIPLPVHKVQTTSDWIKIEEALLYGQSILLIDGFKEAVILQTKGAIQPLPTQPHSQKSIYGSKQGFVEMASVNISLIRHYIPNQELKVKAYKVGTRAASKVYFVYLEDVINPNILRKAERCLEAIDIDAISNTGELSDFFEDRPYSLFPQTLLSERPDSTARHILQGKLAIILDHSPFAMIVPFTFFSYFHSVDDYNFRWITSSFVRLLRFLSLIIAVGLPSLYISIISFHFEVVPLDLMLSLAASREKVPLPPILEALLMEIAIEMIREAGVRLPSPLGQTIGVVGGIVIGEAVVQANIVSNVMVIVVAITAISSYIIPYYELANSVRIVRFPLMAISSVFGIVGLAIGVLIIVIHLLSMQPMGSPYMNPVTPIQWRDWKDTWIRVPTFQMLFRLSVNQAQQQKRQDRQNR